MSKAYNEIHRIIPYLAIIANPSGFQILEHKESPIPWAIIFKGINSNLLDGYVSRFREQTKRKVPPGLCHPARDGRQIHLPNL